MTLEIIKKNWAIIILAILVVWGACLRLYNLGDQSLWMDESYSAIAIERIAETGLPQLESDHYYWRGITHNYPTALFQLIFGKSTAVLRLPASLFGIGTILLTYLAGLTFFKKKSIALIAAALVTFGVFDIGWSRQIRMYTELQFFFLLSVTAFYKYFIEKKPTLKKGLIVILLTLLTVETHLQGMFLFAAYGAMLWLNKDKISAKTKQVILFSALGAVFLSLLLDFGSILRIISGILSDFHFYLPNYLTFLGKFHTVVLAMGLVGMVMAFRKKNREALLIGVIFGLTLLILGSSYRIAMRYLFFAIPFLYLIAAYGMDTLTSIKKYRYLSSLIIFALLALSFQNSFTLNPKSEYFLEHDPLSNGPKLDYTPQPDFKKAYQFIEKNKKSGDLMLVAHTAIHKWYLPDSDFYWLGFNFGLDPSLPDHATIEQGDYFVDVYTGTGIVDDLEILQELMETNHGYIIWDYFAIDSRLSQPIIEHIRVNAELVYNHQADPELAWTGIWIYKF
ncbi:glycosyltransferase family 39 protein [bacterium]|nr:glycosyltransferase family 39 protein [bacterium]MBU1634368.1 glycosyltransferase family 39 protein [bacterium]MBU1900954.1 glycosyltransferase family 39 protein [Patescibacteria group bacterium]